MIFSPRIRLRPLVDLCRRLAMATSAGIDDRKIWRDEGGRGGATQRAVATQVADRLARGESVGDALAASGGFLPPLFKQLVAVGDASGQLDRAYRRLAEHYEHAVAARRALLAGLAWPLIQLAIAALVIGGTIWISDVLGLKGIDGEPVDIFGLGLVGARGLAIYIGILTLVMFAVVLAIEATRRGMFWTRRLQRLVVRVPIIRGAVETLSLARFCWTMHIILQTSMDLRKALPLALDATGNDFYRRETPDVVQRLAQGMPLHQALAATGAFPAELIDAIAVGEQSGMLAETMERQARQYQDRGADAIGQLAMAFGWLVWAAIAAVIITLVFRVVTGYSTMLQNLSKPGAF
jgi:type II secretory pathway component PulF